MSAWDVLHNHPADEEAEERVVAMMGPRHDAPDLRGRKVRESPELDWSRRVQKIRPCERSPITAGSRGDLPEHEPSSGLGNWMGVRCELVAR